VASATDCAGSQALLSKPQAAIVAVAATAPEPTLAAALCGLVGSETNRVN